MLAGARKLLVSLAHRKTSDKIDKTDHQTLEMSDPAEIEKYVTSLKVVELKDELKKRHLSYVGNKQVLAQRLKENMLRVLQQRSSTSVAEEEEGDAAAEQESKEAEGAEATTTEVNRQLGSLQQYV